MIAKVKDTAKAAMLSQNVTSVRSIDDFENRAQPIVTRDDCLQSLDESFNVKWAREARGRRRVVQRLARHQLIQNPKALLVVRERRRRSIRATLDRSRRLGAPVLLHQAQLEQLALRR